MLQRSKKILCLLLVAALLMGLVPMSAMAVDGQSAYVGIVPLSDDLTSYVTVTDWDLINENGVSIFTMSGGVPFGHTFHFSFSWEIALTGGQTIQAGDSFRFQRPQPTETGNFTFPVADWEPFRDQYNVVIGHWRIQNNFIEVEFNANATGNAQISGSFETGLGVSNQVARGGIQPVRFAEQYRSVHFLQRGRSVTTGWQVKSSVHESSSQIGWQIDTFREGERWLTGQYTDTPGVWGQNFTPTRLIFEDTLSGRFVSASFRMRFGVPHSMTDTDSTYGFATTSTAFDFFLDDYMTRLTPNAGESYANFRTRVTATPWQWGVWRSTSGEYTVVAYWGTLGVHGPTLEGIDGIRPTFATEAAAGAINAGFYDESYRDALIAYFTAAYGNGNIIGGRIPGVRIRLDESFDPVGVNTDRRNVMTITRFSPPNSSQGEIRETPAIGVQRPMAGGAATVPGDAAEIRLLDQITSANIEGGVFQLQVLNGSVWEDVSGRTYTTNANGYAVTDSLSAGTFRFIQVSTPAPYHLPSSAGFQGAPLDTVVSTEFIIVAGAQRGPTVIVQNIRRFLVTYNLHNGEANRTEWVVHNQFPANVPQWPADFTRPNHVFRGWGETATATGTVNPAGIQIAQNRTFHALWDALTITKSASVTEILAGETFNYTLTVTNPSPTHTIPIGTVVGDNLNTDRVTWVGNPRGTITLPSGTPSTFTPVFHHIANGELRVSLPALPPGAVVAITFDVQARIDRAGQTVSNTAFIEGVDGTPNTPSNTVNTQITGSPGLVTTKTVTDADGDGYAAPGEELEYVITIVNNGNTPAFAVEVQDSMSQMINHIITPVDTDLVTINNGGVISTVTVPQLRAGIEIPRINPNTTVTLTFTVVVDPDLDVDAMPELVNIVTVNGDDSSTGIYTGEPGLATTKEVTDADGDGYAAPGEVLTYRITIVNNGDAVATNVFVQDDMAEMYDYIYSPSAIQRFTMNNNGVTTNPLMSSLMDGFYIPRIESGATVTITFTVRVLRTLDIEEVTYLRNTVLVNDRGTDEEIPTGDRDLRATKTVSPSIAVPGEDLTYTIRLENRGTVVVSNIWVQDPMTDLLPHLVVSSLTNPVTVRAYSIASPPIAGASFTDLTVQGLVDGIMIPSMGQNEIIYFIFTVTVDLELSENITHLNNLALVRINTDPDDPNPGNTGEPNPDPDNDLQVTVPVRRIEATKSVTPTIAVPGEDLTYTIRLENLSGITVNNVWVQDRMDDLIPHLVTSSLTNPVTVEGLTGTFTVQDLVDGIIIDSMATGAVVSFTFTVEVQDDLPESVTELTNVAIIREGIDPNDPPYDEEPTDDDPYVTVPVRRIEATKTVSPTIAVPGEDLTYTIRLENLSAITVNNVWVQDRMDDLVPHLVASSLTNPVTVTGMTGTFTVQDLVDGVVIDSVAAGAVITFEFTVEVRANLPETVTQLTNVAIVREGIDPEYPPYDEEPTDDDPYVTVPVRRIEATKTVSPMIAVPGEDLTYTIRLENLSAITVNNVWVQDRMDDLISHLVTSSLTNPVVVTGVTGTFTVQDLVDGVNIPMMAAGAVVTFEFTVEVRADLPETVTQLTNVAIVREGIDPEYPPYDEEPGDDDPYVTVPVRRIEATKTVSPTIAVPGEDLTYTIRLENLSEVAVSNVWVQDRMDDLLPHLVASSLTNPVTVNGATFPGLTVQGLVDGVTIPSMAVDAVVTFEFTVEVRANLPETVTQLTNVAIIREGIDPEYPPYDEEPGDDDPYVTVPVRRVEATKTVSPTIAMPGEDLTYTIRLENLSEVAVSNVWVQDRMDGLLPHLATSSLTNPVTVDGATFPGLTVQGLVDGVTIPSMAVGAVVTFEFTVEVQATLPENVTQLTNVAIVREGIDPEYPPYDEEPGPGDPGVTVPIARPTLTKTANRTTAAVNDRIIYTLTVTNLDDVLEDFVVVDRLNTTYVRFERATLRVNDEVVADEDMSFINGVLRVYIDLPEDSVTTITFEVTVLPAAAGRTITNTAILQGPSDEPGGDHPQVGPETPPVNVVVPPPGGGGGGGGNGGGEPGDDDPWRQAFLIGHSVPAGQERPIDPRGNITRAQVATIFFRMVTDETRAEYWMQTNPFEDVTINRWFNNAISTTANMGLFEGIGDDNFAPDQYMTRGELAAVLVRFMEQDQIGPYSLDIVAASDAFSDTANHWARTYINRAAAAGWIQGYPDGTFRPSQPITRAETAAMINRIFQRLIETPDCRLEDMVSWPDNQNQNSWYFLYMYMATNSYTYRWRDDSDTYKELIEIIDPRNWSVLERPNSRPEHIFLSSPQVSV